MDRGIWVYDIETFNNFFSCIYYNIDTNERRDFVVCEWRDELSEFIEFTTSDEMKGMIGYNNIGFDYPVIHKIITRSYQFKNKTGEEKARIIKAWANRIINSEFSSISRKNTKIPQLDIFRYKGLNGTATFASLKQCEFVMRWPSLQDLPFPHDHEVTEDQINDIMVYNFNDVAATHQLYLDTVGAVELRKKLGKQYGIKVLNSSDPKIGSEIFASILCDKKGITWQELKDQRTIRSEIKLKDCIFDYVEFQSKEFNDLLTFLKSKTITETKGVFKDLIVIHKGLSYVYGLGGLHASCKAGVYEIDDEHELIDIDVASFYPNLSIKNKVFIEHLGEEFVKIYSDLYDQRKKAKKSGDKITNAGLKLSLNGTYGLSNNRHSYLYDSQWTMTITLNGQLLLTMMAEKLATISTVLQCNTDGIVVRIHKTKVEEMKDMVKWWEDLTQLEMEYTHYSKMVVSNVNNYIAVCTDGKVKYKGQFEIDKVRGASLVYNKDHSKRIVPLAVSRYFIDGIPVRETIENHLTNEDYGKVKNHGIFDFCLLAKGKRIAKGVPKMTLRVSENGIIKDTTLQKTNRYYMSNSGGHFIRKYDDGSTSKVEAHPQKGRYYKSTMANEITKKDHEKTPQEWDVDYNYYTREANKIINSIIDFNYSLF